MALPTERMQLDWVREGPGGLRTEERKSQGRGRLPWQELEVNYFTIFVNP